ncbi:MAG: hypothetical protein ACLF0G_02495 [Candidatus Brocadiia bacterium]
MRRALRRCALVLVVLVPVAGAVGGEVPRIRFRQLCRVRRNGDIEMVNTFTLPVQHYTRLRQEVSNTALLLRELGVGGQVHEFEAARATYDDAAHAIRLTATMRGGLKHRGSHWFAEIVDAAEGPSPPRQAPPPPEPPRPQPAPQPEPPQPKPTGPRRVEHPRGLYAVEVPGDWRVYRDGDELSATAPGEQAILVVGVGQRSFRSLQAFANAVVRSRRERYERWSEAGRDLFAVSGHQAMMIQAKVRRGGVAWVDTYAVALTAEHQHVLAVACPHSGWARWKDVLGDIGDSWSIRPPATTTAAPAPR